MIMRTLVTHIVLCMALLTAWPANAADTPARRSNWGNKMLEYKHDFILEQVKLTKEQQDKFLPLYESMEREIFNVNREAREQAKKVAAMARPTDADYAAAAEALAGAKYREGVIEKSYYDKFEKILNKKQLFQLKQAEIKFTRTMLSRGNRNKK